MNKANFFEKMVLQIPLDSTDVVEFYCLSLIDQEILTDDVRTFITTKLSALRAIKDTSLNLLDVPQGQGSDILKNPPPAKHQAKLKSSYNPDGGVLHDRQAKLSMFEQPN